VDTTPASTIAERVGALVRIPSVNPLQAGPRSGEDGERAVSAWLADQADALGAEVTVDEVVDGRANVYARFVGTTERTVTIDVHLDTVGVEHMIGDPFDGRIEDDRVYGRGAVDTKATLAIVLSVMGELRAGGRRPMPTVNLVGTISEEMGGLIGATRYRDWLDEHGTRVDQLIVAEPTLCAPVHGHMGGVGLEISVRGHAAHSSKPHLGKNAISAAARIIGAIDAEQDRLAAMPPSTAVGNGTLSVTEIVGGLARNIIPDHCQLYAGRRTAPGEDPEEIFEQLCELVRAAAAPLEVEIELANGMASAAFYQDPESPIVRALAAHAHTAPDVASFGSNALRYDTIADEIVLFGPGSIDQAHQAIEWVDISELAKAANIYRTFLTVT
jgi:acetylornithine deacetylase/succinyl-diaminopimelate desuccinylase-like protein